ncbi:enoyl-CoA hydratase-related protein [Magnetovibrio sp. PR-2]|uniref:enoyl-CoA hydratase-related protein n=1 Tax=Magnetovibrio sp. PR-2 TaxID=3120356 RepID=UPI002FCDEB1A
MSHVFTPKDCTLTLNNRVATLTFNRDDVRNALTGTALIDDIVDTVNWANTSPEVSVLVLTGTGSAFSAGGNIKDMRERAGDFGGNVAELENRYRRGIQRIPLALHNAELPTIAAVNGPAIGAGLDVACMCDIRIGSTKAKFGETFVNLGIIPGDGGAWFLQRLIGYQRAAELTLSGRVIGADEAKDIGLLLEVAEPDTLMEQAHDLAATMAAKPPQALRYAKRLMKMAQRQELPDFLDFCATVQGICHNTEDHTEAVSAFLEKRDPSYTGR